MKRIFDLIFSIILLIVLIIPIIFISLLIFYFSGLPVIHWSKRIGLNNCEFDMPKFRTMKKNSPQIETALLNDSEKWVTPIGAILRKSSLDEIPQLWSVLKGDMSFVGPRPALYNQYSLIKNRTHRGINEIKPGITGLAQINGRDLISDRKKIKYDYFYLKKNSLIFDIKIILITLNSIRKSKNILH